jgi:HlyD family secretion protein
MAGRGARRVVRAVGTVALLLGASCRPAATDLVLVGTVERTLIELVAPVSETVLEVRVVRGQAVRRGDTLVRLDPTLAEAELAHADATLVGARTGLVITGHDLVRLEGLHRARVASVQDLERAQLARDEAAARFREAEALLAAARKRLDDLTLVAPVAGVVDQIPFDPGERVPAGGVVVVVLDDGAPWVRVWVPEQNAAQMRPGTAARVRVDGVARELAGSVLDVAREPEFTPHYALTERDRAYLVYETRVRVDDAPRELRPGVPAEVTLLPATESAVVVR